jgi:hypothetical protein
MLLRKSEKAAKYPKKDWIVQLFLKTLIKEEERNQETTIIISIKSNSIKEITSMNYNLRMRLEIFTDIKAKSLFKATIIYQKKIIQS